MWGDRMLAALHRLRLRRQFSGQPHAIHHISNPWHAVSIATGLDPCRAAIARRGQRVLSKDAPTLPLTNCSHPGECECRFKHHADRRSHQRRARDSGLPTGAHMGDERRGPSRGRRAMDV